MDNQQQSTQPISDDQELAKVLAGVSGDPSLVETTPAPSEVQPPVAAGDPPVVEPTADTADASTATLDSFSMPPMPEPVATAVPAADGELDGVKQAAISELRPLVDKLTLPPEEKFDTYLLLIRSTDDRSLVAPAHQAAKAIPDEARRAQALLDIIKEIDFLSGHQQPAA